MCLYSWSASSSKAPSYLWAFAIAVPFACFALPLLCLAQLFLYLAAHENHVGNFKKQKHERGSSAVSMELLNPYLREWAPRITILNNIMDQILELLVRLFLLMPRPHPACHFRSRSEFGLSPPTINLCSTLHFSFAASTPCNT